MNLSFFIARRYFKAKHKQSFSNIITRIAMVGIAVGTMALVVVLSVYNGMGDLVRSLYNSFDPEIKIAPAQGKTFAADTALLRLVRGTEGVAIVSEVLEDNAYAKYKNAEMVVTVKGVSPNYIRQSGVRDRITNGEFLLENKENGQEFTVIGAGVRYELSVNLRNDFYPVRLYYPKKGKIKGSLNPTKNLNSRSLMVSGVFESSKGYNLNYVYVPLETATKLMQKEGRLSALEVKVLPDADVDKVQRRLKKALGKSFTVKNREEQQALLSKVLRIEKLFFFVALSFILFIASFNIFFSLSMLVIEKKKDIAVLFSIGATRSLVRKIFMFEGFLVAMSGAVTGLLTGLLICILQEKYGWVKMGIMGPQGDYWAYPVSLDPVDISATVLVVILLTILATVRPARLASKYKVTEHL
ncbi:membrane protein [Fulvitalea axinellae]|uniref:Membrane protein n=1 Tax=Fulvitalea axinellae TaxID=1182444 RepID=A0AAU9CI53_9BACT|nr:membrane protein [Fulvitalea axinellae]